MLVGLGGEVLFGPLDEPNDVSECTDGVLQTGHKGQGQSPGSPDGGGVPYISAS